MHTQQPPLHAANRKLKRGDNSSKKLESCGILTWTQDIFALFGSKQNQ